VVERLVVPSLNPGTYLLEIEGSAPDLEMGWDRPPEPQDSDEDGTIDFYDSDV
jgi:hypothetical protein